MTNWKRYFAFLMGALVLLASALTAQALTSTSAARVTTVSDTVRSSNDTTAFSPARLVSARVILRTGEIQAAAAAHTAHLGHLARVRHHAAYVALLAARAAAASASAAAARADIVASQPVPAYVAPSAPASGQTPASAGSSAPASGTYSGGGGFQSCVIARESGGNSQVMNGSGHYGLYQFSAGTWAAYGGNPGSFGNASVAQQNQVFANAMAQPGGAQNWQPYDGCVYTKAAVKGAQRNAIHYTLTAAVRPLLSAQAAHAAHLAHLRHLAQLRAEAAHAAHLAHLAHMARIHPATMAVVSSGSASGLAGYAQSFAHNGSYYVYGGTGPRGFDCSGLVQYVYAHFGRAIPRTSEAQAAYFHRTSSPQPGDLVSYWSGNDASHSAIYLGGGKVISALSSYYGVVVTSLSFPGGPYSFGTLR